MANTLKVFRVLRRALQAGWTELSFDARVDITLTPTSTGGGGGTTSGAAAPRRSQNRACRRSRVRAAPWSASSMTSRIRPRVSTAVSGTQLRSARTARGAARRATAGRARRIRACTALCVRGCSARNESCARLSDAVRQRIVRLRVSVRSRSQRGRIHALLIVAKPKPNYATHNEDVCAANEDVCAAAQTKASCLHR